MSRDDDDEGGGGNTSDIIQVYIRRLEHEIRDSREDAAQLKQVVCTAELKVHRAFGF